VPDGVERAQGMDPTSDLDDWGVAGGGCGGCTTGGGPIGALGLLLVVAALHSRRRRRSGRASSRAFDSTGTPISGRLVESFASTPASIASLVALVSLLFALTPFTAQAQAPVSTAIDIQQFKPAPGARDILALHSASVLAEDFAWSARLVSHFAAAPLRTVSPLDPTLDRPIIQHQLTFDVVGSVAFRGRYELGVQVPLTLQGVAEGALAGTPLQAFGLGDLRLVPKGRIWENDTLAVAAALPIVLPTGGAQSFLGGAGVSVQPRAVAEWSRGAMRLIANVGFNFRGEQILHNLSVGNQFAYGVGVEVPFAAGARDFAAAATLGGTLGLGQNDPEERPLELLAAVRWAVMPGLGVQVGGGRGLGQGYGAPSWRGMLGLSWTPQPRPATTPEIADKP
jgi:MYXO-CTERM domain-containing protein